MKMDSGPAGERKEGLESGGKSIKAARIHRFRFGKNSRIKIYLYRIFSEF